MIMISAGVLLVRVGGVEGRAFVHVGVVVPITAGVAGGAGVRRAVVIKRVPTIEHRDTVNENANRAAAVEGFGRGRRGRAREAKERFLVFGQIWKTDGPGTHDVAAEAGGKRINPIRGRINFLDAVVGREGLGLAAIAPGGDGVARGFRSGIGINARVLAGIGGEPGGELRIGVERADGECGK